MYALFGGDMVRPGQSHRQFCGRASRCDYLGFSIDFASEDWCFLSRDGVQLMIGHCPDALPAAQIGDHAYFAYIEVEAVDDLYAELRARGLAALPPPEGKPWGMREFMLSTPDGHRIVFGQEIDAA